MQDVFEPHNSCEPMLLAIPSFSRSMESIIGAETCLEPSTLPRGSMEHVNMPLDREPDMQNSGDGEVDMQEHFGDIDKAPDPQTIPDEGEIDDSDDESVPTASEKEAKHELPPTVKQLKEAMVDLEKLLHPPRCNKRKTYNDPGFDKKTIKHLEAMKLVCFNVLELEANKAPGEMSQGIWTKASDTTARSLGHSIKSSQKPGTKKAKNLRRWLCLFIDDRKEVPTCNWSMSGRSLIDDEDFAQEIHAHLQTLGPYVSAEAIVKFLGTPEMLERLHQKKTINSAMLDEENGLPVDFKSQGSIC